MNWGAITVVLGLLGLALFTMPWGIAILLGMAWMYRRG